MKRTLLVAALCCLSGAATAQPDALRELQDSVWRWRAAHADDPLAQNIRGSSQGDDAVEVRLLRADSAARGDFRLRVHDSPAIRLCGFDPDTTPYPAAPEGEAPPACLTMTAAQAFYPPGTENVTLTIRYRGDEAVWFGTEYTLSRFRHGRWEVLPVCEVWHALLIGLGRPEPPAPGAPHQVPAEGYVYDMTVWLAPKIFPVRYGRYRVSKAVYTEHPRRDYLLSAEFTVTPFVPFTRFSR